MYFDPRKQTIAGVIFIRCRYDGYTVADEYKWELICCSVLAGDLRGNYNLPVILEQWIGPDDRNSSVNIIQVNINQSVSYTSPLFHITNVCNVIPNLIFPICDVSNEAHGNINRYLHFVSCALLIFPIINVSNVM